MKEKDFRIRLVDRRNGEHLANKDLYNELINLPRAKELKQLMWDFQDLFNDFLALKGFLEPYIIEIIQEKIPELLKFGSCHYYDFSVTYSKLINERDLSKVINQLVQDKTIERTVNGWYRLPKKGI